MIKKIVKIIFPGILLLCALQSSSQVKTPVQSSKHVFSFKSSDFLLDGKPIQLVSGEMHPARIPKEYWRHRIQMAKAMGCNTIAAYIMWNYHETSPGVFDFKTGNRNMAEFVKICQEEGMWVLFR